MSSKKSNIYVSKKSKNGDEILCPIEDNGDTITNDPDDLEDCVEQDVVGRYAGNIEIRSSSEPEKK